MSDAVSDRQHSTPTRRVRAGLVALLGLIALAVPAVAGAATTVSKQMETVRRLEVELAGLDARHGQAAAAYDAARARLEEIRDRIAANTAALADARTEYATARLMLSNRLSVLYRTPAPSGLQILLRTGSLSEALSRVEFLERAQREDARLIRSISAARDRMRAARVRLLADQRSAKNEKKETADRLAEVRSIRSARLGVLSSARRQLTVMIAQAQAAADARRLATLRAAQQRVQGQRESGGVPAPVTPTAPISVPDKLRQIAQCESGGNPSAVSPSGLYRGKYQFDPQTWKSLGGAGDDPAAASEAEQDRVASLLYSQRGAAPWPVCGR
jgi:peptidoglycan hydrolase CwlO-like protein